MSEFLKSAMGYFNNGPNAAPYNEFVGQTVEVGSVKLRVKRVIGEGLSFFLKNFFHCVHYYACIHPQKKPFVQ